MNAPTSTRSICRSLSDSAFVQAGLKIAAKNLQAGKEALAERDYRRRGLLVALIFIFITVAALYFYIRQIEREPAKT